MNGAELTKYTLLAWDLTAVAGKAVMADRQDNLWETRLQSGWATKYRENTDTRRHDGIESWRARTAQGDGLGSTTPSLGLMFVWM